MSTEWKNAPSRGYYWRHLARGEQPLSTDGNTVAFATSEPRVLRETDWQWFQRALNDNDPYVDTFTANAHSDWQPLWCLERNRQASGERGNFRHWLLGFASIFPDA